MMKTQHKTWLLIWLLVWALPLFAASTWFERLKTKEGERWKTRPSSAKWMREQIFIPEKAHLRIVCLGGSVTYGFPLPREGAYPHVLKRLLSHFHPSIETEVISMGLLNGDAQELEKALDEALALQPHLLVLEVGNMELLNLWGKPESGQGPSAFLNDQEAEAPPLDRFVLGNVSLRQHVEESLRTVRRMLKKVLDRQVKVVLLSPGSNLKARPIYDDSESKVHSVKQKEIAGLMHLVNRSRNEDPAYTIRCLNRVVDLLPRSPSFAFIQANQLDAYGHFQKAAEAYQRAMDLDRQPIRPTSDLVLGLKKLADELEVKWIDGQDLANKMSKHGIAGYSEYIDHLHPRRELHLLFARVLMLMAGAGQAGEEGDLLKAMEGEWNWSDRVWSDVWYKSARSLAYCGEKLVAKALFKKSLSFNKQNMDSLIGLAEILVEEGELKVASGLMGFLLGNENWAYLELGKKIKLAEVLAILKEDQVLPKILEEADGKDPRWSKVRAFQGMSEERYAEAIPHLKQALVREPLDLLLLKAIEVAFVQSEQWEDYLQWLKERLVDDRSRQRVMALMDKVVEEGRKDDGVARAGIDLIKFLLSLQRQQEVKPWITLAELYAAIGQWHRAVESLERCIMISVAYDLPISRPVLEEKMARLKEGKDPWASAGLLETSPSPQ